VANYNIDWNSLFLQPLILWIFITVTRGHSSLIFQNISHILIEI
jgi:hypothetical protein